MISVIVTNFNYEKYLGRCLRSLLDQTLSEEEFEIILVDDSSTDNSLNVAKAFADQITIIANEHNVGLATSANIGIRVAKGRFVVRVDSDDYVHPEFLRFLLRYMELKSESCDGVALDYLEVDDQGNFLSEKDAMKYPIACGIAFKIEVMLELGLYEPGLRIGEDRNFIGRFREEGFVLDHLPLSLYRYTKHENSLTWTKGLI